MKGACPDTARESTGEGTISTTNNARISSNTNIYDAKNKLTTGFVAVVRNKAKTAPTPINRCVNKHHTAGRGSLNQCWLALKASGQVQQIVIFSLIRKDKK